MASEERQLESPPLDKYPKDLDSERAALACCLMRPDSVDEISDLVSDDDWWLDAHRILFNIIRGLHESGKPVENGAILTELHSRSQYEAVGGIRFLAELLETHGFAISPRYYAEKIRAVSQIRQLIETCEKTINDCRQRGAEASDLLCDAEERIFQISEKQVMTALFEPRQLIDEFEARMAIRDAGNTPGVEMGFCDVDAHLGGMKPGQIIIVAARPSMGKSGLGLGILTNLALNGQMGLLFTLEMGREELTDRMVCMEAKVDTRKLQFSSHLSKDERDRIKNSTGMLRNSMFRIDETGARNVSQIAAVTRRLKRRHNLQAVIVDYLQLIDVPDSKKSSRQEDVAGISRMLKRIAKDTHIPFVVLSQLNRNCEERDDKRPRMSDIRESGGIEQDADVVLLIHRPEYYDPNDDPGIAEIIVAKNRNGPTGTIKLMFQKSNIEFANLADSRNDDRNNGSY